MSSKELVQQLIERERIAAGAAIVKAPEDKREPLRKYYQKVLDAENWLEGSM